LAKEKKDTTQQSWKKKTWYQIYSRKSFNEVLVGESLAADPTELIGKTLGVNLMTLSGDIKKQHVTVTFKIAEFKDNKLYADPIALKTSHSAIKRQVRRGRDRLDDSFSVQTKDGVTLRVKPLMITKTNTNNSVLKLVRKACNQALTAYVKKADVETVFKDAITFRIHSAVRGAVNKIYPLRSYELKYLGLDTHSKVSEQEAPAVITEEAAAQ